MASAQQRKQLTEQKSDLQTQEKAFTIYLLDRGLVSRLYKKIQKSNNKTNKQLSKKWINEMNTQFSGDETQRPGKTNEEKVLALLAISEM